MKQTIDLAPVVQRPDNFIRWIRHYSWSKINFTFNVVQGFRTLPNFTVVRVCIFTCTRENTEIFAQNAGQKTSAHPPVRDEYSRISDKWISKSTCPMGRVEFAYKKMFVSTKV